MFGERIKGIGVLLLSAAVLSTSVFSASSALAAGDVDYSTAFKNSIIFFDANKCGNDVTLDNAFDWRRGPCHITDGKDVGIDLTGGYHDAGDHVKFGLPQAYAASVMGWSLYEFKDSFDATNNTAKMLGQLKYFTDYFLKSHPEPGTFYYQVGDGTEDHNYWGAPELQTGDRPTLYVANAANPASDICGETSAALTLMYLNYKDVDNDYAAECLQAAKEIYAIGRTKTGIGSFQHFYQSTSPADDMAWGGAWLYEATRDEKYLIDAKSFALEKNSRQEDPLKNKWTMCWDNMYLAAHVKLAELTGDAMYKNSVEFNLDYWLDSVFKTPGGLYVLDYWGVLRYAAAECMVAQIYYKQNPDKRYLNFAKSQMDYILGKNPANMSYEIGFGTRWSKYVHHRAAQGGQGYADNADKTPAKYVILGALIGGPDKTDTFKEDVNEYQYTEVAIDYNAGFVGALAGVVKHFGSIVTSTPSPTKTSTPTPTKTSAPTPTNPTVTGYKITGYVSPDFISAGRTSAVKAGFRVELDGIGIWAQTDEKGYFELGDVPGPASYTLKISKKSFLTREIDNVNIVSSGVQIAGQSAPIALWAGDMSGDNAINMIDITKIARSFNSASGDGRFNADSDINKDNAVNMNDIVIIAKHFNTTSASYPKII